METVEENLTKNGVVMSSQKKRPFFLLRGLIRDPFHWYGFSEYLQKAFSLSGDDIILGSLPQPCSYREALRYSQPQWVMEHISKQVPKGEGGVEMVGVSLGGLLLFHWARRYPERVHTLSIINVSHPDFSSPFKRFSPQALWKLGKAHLISRPLGEEAVLECTVRSVERRDELLAKAQKYQRVNPWNYYQLFSQLWLAHRCGEGVSPESSHHRDWPGHKKVLMLVGERDQLVHPQCSRSLAQHFSLPLRSHPYGGHDLTTEDPQWCVERIHEWVRELAGKD